MPSAGPAVDRPAALVGAVLDLRATDLALAALGSPPLALRSNNQVLVTAHGLTDANTEAIRISAVIRDGGNADGLSDPQGHRRGAVSGARARGSDHGRGQRGDEPLWVTAAFQGQADMVRAALAGDGIDTLNDAAFALSQFAHGARA